MHPIEDTETVRPSRLEFCVHACQAASLVAAGAMWLACGGNSMAPSNATNLPTINATGASGSPFSATGGVVKGPVAQPLRQFTTRFSGNLLTITV